MQEFLTRLAIEANLCCVGSAESAEAAGDKGDHEYAAAAAAETGHTFKLPDHNGRRHPYYQPRR